MLLWGVGTELLEYSILATCVESSDFSFQYHSRHCVGQSILLQIISIHSVVGGRERYSGGDCVPRLGSLESSEDVRRGEGSLEDHQTSCSL